MWNTWWKLKRNVKWVACFFAGHNVRFRYGGYEDELPDYCERCLFTEEERNIHDGITIPHLLYLAVCWFNALDDWVIRQKWHPVWWTS